MDPSRALSTRVSRLVLALALAGGVIGTTIIGFVGAAPGRLPAESQRLAAALDGSGAHSPAPRADAPKTGDDLFELRGRVVDPDGRPVTGARIYVERVTRLLSEEVRTDSEGRFAFPMRKVEFALNDSGIPWSYAKLMAVAEGYGIDLQAACSFEPTGRLLANVSAFPFPVGDRWDRTLRLVKDDVPIVGTIVNVDGNPVAGATIRVCDISIPKAPDLASWVKAVERGEDYDIVFLDMMDRRIEGRPLPAMPTAVTGSDGTFRLLGGIGRERIARLQIAGPGIVSEHVYVRARPGSTYVVPHVLEVPRSGTFRFFGSTFTYTAKPSLPIEGVVRDKDSRQPVEGVSLHFESHFDSGGAVDLEFDSLAVRTATDRQGRFVLTGAPLGNDHRILAIPSGQPYLPAAKGVRLVATQSPPKVEFALTKGITIEGRITDAETGAPVQAQLTYFLPTDNPRSRAVKDLALAFLMPWQEPFKTNERGEYANVGLPGRGFIAVLAQDHRSYPRGASTPQTTQRHEGWPSIFLPASPFSCVPANYNYVAEVNIPDGASKYKYDIVLNPEKQVEGILVDPDGKPLSGAVYAGLTEVDGPYFPLLTPRFTVASYQPDRPRQVFFLHRDRKLAGSVLLKGPQTTRLTVALRPWAAVTGRIVDAHDKPQANALIRGYAPGHGNRPGRGELPERHYHTDGSGRFHIEGFVPGLKYEIELIVNGELVHTSAAEIQLNSGETRDLRDVAIESK